VELNPEQRRAVETVRGPVCILAGAGTGKTTTITHRIANQVASRAFRANEILAVTFTDKAARELRSRLEALGAPGVRARTFHSAALAQLRHFDPDAVGRIVPSKALALRQIGNTLPMPYKFRPAADLATEVERAKNRRVTPDRYLAELGDHEPPIPADLMQRVYARYERVKAERGLTDFEDLLELAVRQLEESEPALAEVRERYRAFTVDEYQDVNLLQQTLLDLWLGPRDELCVVGDDLQSIYAFTGATPEYLLGVASRFPHAAVIRLESNYRSTPQILTLANRLGGALSATGGDGPEPVLEQCDDEGAFVVEQLRSLGLPYEEVAVLCRTNARLTEFEESLHRAGIPSQGSSFLARESARFVLRRLRSPADVRRLAEEHGWLPDPPDKLGERELVRQQDLARLVALAEELADLDGPAFVAELERRFADGGESRRGVHLLTLHGAKGLEFEAVFVAHVEEKELPSKLSKTPAEIAEERRLLYVGLTRAKRHLFVTWTRTPSRFLRDLGVEPPRRAEPVPDDPIFAALKEWRLARAKADEVPAYVVFHNTTLAEIADRKPRTLNDLARVPGVGPTKLERYGDDVLAVLATG
jgi:DNA helicase II / ATP-dependent DNA helicase PcrA